ncbi:hypothetical protein [Clostridium thailandense]|uniref:Uncharacterized protein n=1 Tax=Clostridium thailandense TaxID=2794346 RepID=A0A949X1P6_9CLOT|nr:hypothetical protein [Clostridium thailandense]MBV7272359.1 hypothetical protein [Clostridium thailandense]MCH5135928.1 hypothetical protein [Clostridiaceae bacterium UIB06]
MVFNTDISIALKDFNGCYVLQKFSIFKINEINKNFSSLGVEVYNKIICFKIKCPLCGKSHYYKYSINELIRKELSVGGCEALGLPLFYIGRYERVNQIVSMHNNMNKKICAML